MRLGLYLLPLAAAVPAHFRSRSKTLESPNFFLTKDIYKEIYEKKESKTISFTRYFYPRCKKYVEFLVDVKSTDKDNRKPFNIKIHLIK